MAENNTDLSGESDSNGKIADLKPRQLIKQI